MTTTRDVSPTQEVTIGDTFVRVSGQGFPLVFVHGFTTTSEFWKEQAEEFSKSYRVIRINLPGHGASPSPASRSYRIEDFVEDVARVFQHLSIDRAVLIGLSMGGIIAQKIAVKYPHLLEALVLVDTTSHGIGADATARTLSSPPPTKEEPRRRSRTCRTFRSVPPPPRHWSNGHDEKSFKRRNSSLGRRSVRSATPIPAALFLRSRRPP
jgi:pimeloyl-ACP methyl ester carboxylesterase